MPGIPTDKNGQRDAGASDATTLRRASTQLNCREAGRSGRELVILGTT
jgi:hypothetical protein